MAFTYIYEDHGDKHFGSGGQGSKWAGDKQTVQNQAVAYLQQHESDIEAFRSIQDNKFHLSFYIVDDMEHIPASGKDGEDAFVIQVSLERKGSLIDGYYTELTYHLYPIDNNQVTDFGIGITFHDAVENSKK